MVFSPVTWRTTVSLLEACARPKRSHMHKSTIVNSCSHIFFPCGFQVYGVPISLKILHPRAAPCRENPCCTPSPVVLLSARMVTGMRAPKSLWLYFPNGSCFTVWYPPSAPPLVLLGAIWKRREQTGFLLSGSQMLGQMDLKDKAGKQVWGDREPATSDSPMLHGDAMAVP